MSRFGEEEPRDDVPIDPHPPTDDAADPIDPEEEPTTRTRGRVPPNDLDAEALVLAESIISPDSLALVLDILRPDRFYSEANRRIFEAVIALDAADNTVDAVAIAGYLRDNNRLAQCGGTAYLAQIIGSTPATVQVEDHAKRILDLARVRELIANCQRIAAEGYDVKGLEAQSFLDNAERSVFEISQTDERNDVAPIGEALDEAHAKMIAAEARGEAVEISTGLTKLDLMIGGLSRQRVTTVAARPGMGKTSLVTGWVENVATSGGTCAIFSLEMPRWQIARRMACSRAGASVHRGMHGWLHPDERANVLVAQDQLKKLPIWIDGTPAITLTQLRAKSRRVVVKSKTPLTMIVVDYLQLMTGEHGERGTTREREIAKITAGCKQLSKELDCSVVLCCQLNRELESESNKRPRLNHLRESGAIEQDSDDVIFVYRDEYYNADSEDKGIAELIIAKQRNGPNGVVRVGFDGPTTTFHNLRDDSDQTPEQAHATF